MIIPTDALCVKMVEEINDDPQHFSKWLVEFAKSNATRESYTDTQKECLHRAAREYDFDCLKGIQ